MPAESVIIVEAAVQKSCSLSIRERNRNRYVYVMPTLRAEGVDWSDEEYNCGDCNSA